jgi:hypothetical protein
MGFNKDKVKKRKSELSGGNNFTAKEGETLLFFCDTGHPEDEFNFLELLVHYGLGQRRLPAMCLDASRNPALVDPRVIELAQSEKNVDLVAEAKKGCPVCRRVWGTDGVQALPKAEGDDIKANRRYIFPVIPMAYKVKDGKNFQELDPRVQCWNTSYTQWDKITDELVEIGNPTDPESAVFLKVSRKGLKKNDTKYEITTDKSSFREPEKLSKHIKALILKETKPGESADIYRSAADLVKTADEMEALVTGIQVEQPAETTDADDDHPACFGLDYAEKDAECVACDDKGDCAKACGEEVKTEAKADDTKADETPAETESGAEKEADDKPAGNQELDELEKILDKRGAKDKKRSKR